MDNLDDLIEKHRQIEKEIKEIKDLIVSNDEEDVSSNYQILLFEQYHTMELLASIIFRRIQFATTKLGNELKNGENQNGNWKSRKWKQVRKNGK